MEVNRVLLNLLALLVFVLELFEPSTTVPKILPLCVLPPIICHLLLLVLLAVVGVLPELASQCLILVFFVLVEPELSVDPFQHAARDVLCRFVLHPAVEVVTHCLERLLDSRDN